MPLHQRQKSNHSLDNKQQPNEDFKRHNRQDITTTQEQLVRHSDASSSDISSDKQEKNRATATTSTAAARASPSPDNMTERHRQRETVIALEADEEEEQAVMEPMHNHKEFVISEQGEQEEEREEGETVEESNKSIKNNKNSNGRNAFEQNKIDSLPKPWVTMTSSKGKTYYYNTETGDSTWDSPVQANNNNNTNNSSNGSNDGNNNNNNNNSNHSYHKRRRETPPTSTLATAATSNSSNANKNNTAMERHRSRERRPVAQNLVHRTNVRPPPPPPSRHQSLPYPPYPRYYHQHNVRYQNELWVSRRDGLVDRTAPHRNIRPRDPYYHNGRGGYGRTTRGGYR
ncbi:hypothetical protein BDC45DRAFT_350532 [Circinella umbellata]|nr:hypothetical protein BDC45DRAFT_350532 [Circinella umbellata]